jgi:Na+/proline symporter
MGIVMSLAALALAAVTPLTAETSILIMGVLGIIYCTLGGIEAVVWTDTIQTIVLLGGALVCCALMVVGADGGVGTLLQDAHHQGKLHLFNLHWDPTSMSLALWVVIIGGIGQNISSYTADQAVVQRYMTTPDVRRAKNSIWTAALLSVPASWLFFFMGTALWGFYKSHPEKLDPTITTDQILPLFIARETPVGFAGLIVAGIFAAAQSTISTSMNSTSTAVVTDFMRPFRLLKTERGYLNWARFLTFSLGTAGTLLGLLFVHPDIKSLFDEFLKVIGLFMGVLGGLFGLGILTRRTSGLAAFAGAAGGAAIVLMVERWTDINGYIYAAIGITGCVLIGYATSFLLPDSDRDLAGLTIYTRREVPPTCAEAAASKGDA